MAPDPRATTLDYMHQHKLQELIEVSGRGSCPSDCVRDKRVSVIHDNRCTSALPVSPTQTLIAELLFHKPADIKQFAVSYLERVQVTPGHRASTTTA